MPKLGVIFDMDGVLVDSYQPHFESWVLMYKELGITYTETDFAADFGRTSRDILCRRFGEEYPLEKIRAFDERKEALYRDILRDHFPTMDGATAFIESLVADGVSIAVGSSGPPENVALCLEKLGCGDKFSAVVTGTDVTRGKPDPQVFQLAANRMGVLPESCAVVEDAIHGVEAANRARMISIGMTGTVDRSTLGAATLVVDSLRELSPGLIRDLISSRQT